MKSYEIRFKSLVAEDIQGAYDWYEEKQRGLGESFITVIDNCIDLIKTNPLLFPIVYSKCHRALMQKFPFGIYYRIEGNVIIIFGILHLKREPNKIEKRVN